MERSKRALVERCLDPSGGMARNTEDLPIHHSRKINQFAADQKTALAALSPPAVSFAGAITANV